MKEKQIITKEGFIYQAISGFYYVWSEGHSYATKPKGKFRHQQVKPLVGDHVEIEIDLDDSQSESRLVTIFPRKNSLVRPPVANVDDAFIVMSLVEPDFSYNLLDYFLVSIESHQIEPIILLTKYDLLVKSMGEATAESKVKEIKDIYQKIGYQVIVKNEIIAFAEEIESVVNKDAIYIVMGQSGVGKSTLLNDLLPKADIATGEISDYLNRGRHTTREVTLYRLYQGLLADTPGFSAIDFPQIEKEALSQYFPEIWRKSAECRFRGCLHQNEPNCAVKEAVETGEIATSRYENYSQILQKIEQRKPVYRKKEK
ncbi:ribosome small subunit-dependent GTPase A [Globicatella sulfidifaciens]|uniref:ribosome small subunit-dependent GTPase A n=2 Tax=Globicatella sulfidifaciens TaxID=136093 RepID=UPI0035D6940B